METMVDSVGRLMDLLGGSMRKRASVGGAEAYERDRIRKLAGGMGVIR